jgi:serine/threonine protein kinase
VDLNQWLKNRVVSFLADPSGIGGSSSSKSASSASGSSEANNDEESSVPPLDAHVVRTLWLQMLEAMHVLHERRVVHSDLKPANFVFFRGRSICHIATQRNATRDIAREL